MTNFPLRLTMSSSLKLYYKGHDRVNLWFLEFMKTSRKKCENKWTVQKHWPIHDESKYKTTECKVYQSLYPPPSRVTLLQFLTNKMLNQLLFPNQDIEGKNLNILRKIALNSFYKVKIISLKPFLQKISILIQ